MHSSSFAPSIAPDTGAEQRTSFVQGALGHHNFTLEALPGDASFRRYYRVAGADRPLMLMEDPVERPDFAGAVKVEPFFKIAGHLRSLGLNAPEIHAQDFDKGLMLLDDFGDMTYTRLLDGGEDATGLYELAIDVLAHLHTHQDRNGITLSPYSTKAYLNEASLLVDWYIPEICGIEVSDQAREDYDEIWTDILGGLPQDQDTLVLRDYHVDNLMTVEGEAGLMRCGLLDFQDALIGPMAYDVMSLLEDARREVKTDMYEHLLKRYLGKVDVDPAAFMHSFHILAAQRHAKVLGIFVRLAKRDGKRQYLRFLPHVHGLFLRAVDKESLKPLLKWFETYEINIKDHPDI